MSYSTSSESPRPARTNQNDLTSQTQSTYFPPPPSSGIPSHLKTTASPSPQASSTSYQHIPPQNFHQSMYSPPSPNHSTSLPSVQLAMGTLNAIPESWSATSTSVPAAQACLAAVSGLREFHGEIEAKDSLNSSSHHGYDGSLESRDFRGEIPEFVPGLNSNDAAMETLSSIVAPQVSSGGPENSDGVGTFNGGSFRISARDTNSILILNLARGCPIIAKAGAMVAMSTTVTVKGEFKYSLRKLLAGADKSHTTFTGPGELVLAPPGLGDIVAIVLSGLEAWFVGKNAFLSCTQGVLRTYERQSLSQAAISGEGWWIYKITGAGLLWITSFGAIMKKNLHQGENYIIDDGHLVAWNATYVIQRVDTGIISSLASREGFVCKFTGPGTIYYQTRNPEPMLQEIRARRAARAQAARNAAASRR